MGSDQWLLANAAVLADETSWQWLCDLLRAAEAEVIFTKASIWCHEARIESLNDLIDCRDEFCKQSFYCNLLSMTREKIDRSLAAATKAVDTSRVSSRQRTLLTDGLLTKLVTRRLRVAFSHWRSLSPAIKAKLRVEKLMALIAHLTVLGDKAQLQVAVKELSAAKVASDEQSQQDERARDASRMADRVAATRKKYRDTLREQVQENRKWYAKLTAEAAPGWRGAREVVSVAQPMEPWRTIDHELGASASSIAIGASAVASTATASGSGSASAMASALAAAPPSGSKPAAPRASPDAAYRPRSPRASSAAPAVAPAPAPPATAPEVAAAPLAATAAAPVAAPPAHPVAAPEPSPVAAAPAPAPSALQAAAEPVDDAAQSAAEIAVLAEMLPAEPPSASVMAERQKAAEDAFSRADEDGSGTIDGAELKRLLLGLLQNEGLEYEEATVDEFVAKEFVAADKDGSGDVDFDEFVEYYNQLVDRLAAGALHAAVEEAKAMAKAPAAEGSGAQAEPASPPSRPRGAAMLQMAMRKQAAAVKYGNALKPARIAPSLPQTKGCPACGKLISKSEGAVMCGCESRALGGTYDKALTGGGCGHEFNFQTLAPVDVGYLGKPANDRQVNFINVKGVFE